MDLCPALFSSQNISTLQNNSKNVVIKDDSKQDKGFFRSIFLDLFLIVFVRAF